MSFALSYQRYRRAFTRALTTAHGRWTERDGLRIGLRDSATGATGYGEVAPLPWFGTETLGAAISALDSLQDSVDQADIGALSLVANPCTRMALECALADAQQTWPKPLRQAIRNTALLPTDASASDALRSGLAQGYSVFKYKIGVDSPTDEQAKLDTLLAAGQGKLRLDANGGLSESAYQAWLKWCADRPVDHIEQPMPPGQELRMQALAHAAGVTLALDESATSLQRLSMLAERLTDVRFVVKPMLLGTLDGFFAWREQHPQVPIVYSSVMETAIGAAAAMRLALADPHALPCGFGIGRLLPEDGLGGYPQAAQLTLADILATQSTEKA